MHTRGTDAIPLAPRPSLEQYRKQAKDLVKASRTGDSGAVRAWAADWIKRLAQLHDLTAIAEYVVAGSPRYLKTAETLARRGARIDNVISAAALGRVDLVDRFVDDDGALRPHVRLADVPWPRLPKDPKVHLEYALTWAATFGHGDVVELLLRKGVAASAQDGDATALHFAAAFGRMDLVRLLLKHGASLESLNSYDGTVLDGTVWYALNAPVEGVDYAAVVRELLDAGARTDIYPEMESYVDAVLAGRRGGGYPDASESTS